MLEQLVHDIATYVTQRGNSPGFILMDRDTLETLIREDGCHDVSNPVLQHFLDFNYKVPPQTTPQTEFMYIYGVPIVRSQDITGYALSAPSLVLPRNKKSIFNFPGQDWKGNEHG